MWLQTRCIYALWPGDFGFADPVIIKGPPSLTGGTWLQAKEGGDELALYGRGDHMDFDAALTPSDRVAMGLRAAYLLLIFLPFMLLAPLLFLLANLLLRWRRQPPLNGERCAPGPLVCCGLSFRIQGLGGK